MRDDGIAGWRVEPARPRTWLARVGIATLVVIGAAILGMMLLVVLLLLVVGW